MPFHIRTDLSSQELARVLLHPTLEDVIIQGDKLSFKLDANVNIPHVDLLDCDTDDVCRVKRLTLQEWDVPPYMLLAMIRITEKLEAFESHDNPCAQWGRCFSSRDTTLSILKQQSHLLQHLSLTEAHRGAFTSPQQPISLIDFSKLKTLDLAWRALEGRPFGHSTIPAGRVLLPPSLLKLTIHVEIVFERLHWDEQVATWTSYDILRNLALEKPVQWPQLREVKIKEANMLHVTVPRELPQHEARMTEVVQVFKSAEIKIERSVEQISTILKRLD